MGNVVKVRKGNRILDIDEGRLLAHLQQGYDQIDSEGKVVKRATGGRSLSLAEHNAVVDELEKLKSVDLAKENEDLTKENKALKAKVTKLEKELEMKQPDPNAK